MYFIYSNSLSLNNKALKYSKMNWDKLSKGIKNPQIATRYSKYWISEFLSPSDTLVYLQMELNAAPDFEPARDADIRLIDLDNLEDRKEWLAVRNNAFENNWDLETSRRYIENHPDYIIENTWGLYVDENMIGTTSIGHYRRNPDIATARQIGVIQEYKGEGWGEYLNKFKLQKLSEKYEILNVETIMSREPVIYLHFKSGLRPKYNIDYWNSDPNMPRPIQWRANQKLQQMYKKYIYTN